LGNGEKESVSPGSPAMARLHFASICQRRLRLWGLLKKKKEKRKKL